MTTQEKKQLQEKNSAHSWDDDLLKDPHSVADKRTRVQNMFAAIAPSYDLNNRLHSLGMDQHWRRMAVKLAELKATDRVVDVACGTGDLTIAFCLNLGAQQLRTFRKSGQLPSSGLQVFGIDFTFQMLPIARLKGFVPPPPGVQEYVDFGRATVDGITWINGDAQHLPLSGDFADVISIAFGIRNVQDPAEALSEFYRVLRPGGRLIILEFSLPTNALLRSLYNFYFRQVLPRTATLISGDKTGAYKYLPESVNTFIGRPEMLQIMQSAGFEQVQQFPMTFGVCVCYRGVKS